MSPGAVEDPFLSTSFNLSPKIVTLSYSYLIVTTFCISLNNMLSFIWKKVSFGSTRIKKSDIFQLVFVSICKSKPCLKSLNIEEFSPCARTFFLVGCAAASASPGSRATRILLKLLEHPAALFSAYFLLAGRTEGYNEPLGKNS